MNNREPDRSQSGFPRPGTRLFELGKLRGVFGDEKGGRIEFDAQILWGQPAMVLDEIEVDVISVMTERNQDIDDIEISLEHEGQSFFIEERLIPLEGRAEPNLQPEALGEGFEFFQVFGTCGSEIVAVNDQSFS